jgi:hypothetical protein
VLQVLYPQLHQVPSQRRGVVQHTASETNDVSII